MLENNRLNDLLNRFPEDVQIIFKEMIQAYQLGYVDYVYQTDKVDVQNRRIKNLIKSFRRMDYFYVMPLSQDLALEIATQWRYDVPYDFYNAAADPEDYAELVSAEARADRYFAVIRNGALMGYFCFEKTNEGLELGLGMKPSYTGQGNGRAFYKTIEDYLKENLSPKKIRLAVAAFNERAQALYRAVGYTEVNHYPQKTNGGVYDFIAMEKELKDEAG